MEFNQIHIMEAPKGTYRATIKTFDNKTYKIEGCCNYTTANGREIYAIISALRFFRPGSKVAVYCNSSYIPNNFNKRWVYRWEKNGWKNANNMLVKNHNLLQELLNLTYTMDIVFFKPGTFCTSVDLFDGIELLQD